MAVILELKDISHSFDGVKALDDLSFGVAEQTICALIGPNGAGKTTAFDLVSGFLPLQSGRILFNSRDIAGLRPVRVAQLGIARTFQDLRVIEGLTVLDNVLLARPGQSGEGFLTPLLRGKKMREEERLNSERAAEILELFTLTDVQGHLAGTLSYGQQKLLSLACCLASEGELFLLDEPISGIHPRVIETILGLLRKMVEMGKSILFIEHNIEAVQKVADHVIVMGNGSRIAEGRPKDVLAQDEILAAYLE